MTLVSRKIDLRIALGEGAFGEDGQNIVDVSGYRTSVTITRQGSSMSEMQLRIWGLPLDVMRQLTVLNKLTQAETVRNTITVSAGDDVDGMGVVFAGTILEAWADAGNPPEVAFTMSAYEGAMAKVRPIPPTSFSGAVEASVFFASIARQITDGEGKPTPYALENSGVTGVLTDPYKAGTALDQIYSAARDLKCEVVLDQRRAVIAIWPSNGTRGTEILDISPETGLVGYPQFTQNGVAFSTLYTNNLSFGKDNIGGIVRLRSILGTPPGFGDGRWKIVAVQHDLSSEIPGGPWFTRVECGLLNGPAPIISAPSR